MRFTVICAFMLALLWVEQMSLRQADAEFVPNQSPTFDMASGGDTAHQHYRFTGIVPVLNGYAGFQWTHARDGGDLSSNHLKARIEGSHHWNWIGVHAYGRYGKRSTMAQDSVFNGGLSVDLKLVDTEDWGVNAGLGTYGEHETLEEEYQAVIENAYFEVGPRGHLDVRCRWIVVQNEVFLRQDFKSYYTRTHAEIEIPIAKILFFNRIYLVVSGDMEYNSLAKHIDIESLHWNWDHRLRWEF